MVCAAPAMRTKTKFSPRERELIGYLEEYQPEVYKDIFIVMRHPVFMRGSRYMLADVAFTNGVAITRRHRSLTHEIKWLWKHNI
ncbi:hypothetical protein TWF694_004567 [Orbilia ellipsospora]|uniref:Transposase n=1 Tax=Orbilia ellipsospora TaxID=2528407 RepID=A0AAV9WY42_9PEZI